MIELKQVVSFGEDEKVLTSRENTQSRKTHDNYVKTHESDKSCVLNEFKTLYF